MNAKLDLLVHLVAAITPEAKDPFPSTPPETARDDAYSSLTRGLVSINYAITAKAGGAHVCPGAYGGAKPLGDMQIFTERKEMSSRTLAIGGWAAIFSILVYLAIFAVNPDLDFENPSTTVTVLVIVGTVAIGVAFYGLYQLFHDQQPTNMWMLGLAIVGLALTLIPADWAYNTGTILWAGAILLASYLLRTVPRSMWAAWVGYLTGVLWVALGIAGLVGQQSLSDTLNMVGSVPFFVWAIWIGWVMIKASRQPVTAAA